MKPHDQQLLQRLKAAIHSMNPEAEIILFGSRARGEATNNSDWDILILLDTDNVDRATEREYRNQVFHVELETGQPISTFVFSKQDWESKHSITPFYHNIKKEGVSL